MLIKISERANRGRRVSLVSGLLQFNRSNSRLETAGWTDTDNPHSRHSLRANLHKGCDYTRVSPEPKGPIFASLTLRVISFSISECTSYLPSTCAWSIMDVASKCDLPTPTASVHGEHPSWATPSVAHLTISSNTTCVLCLWKTRYVFAHIAGPPPNIRISFDGYWVMARNVLFAIIAFPVF